MYSSESSLIKLVSCSLVWSITNCAEVMLVCVFHSCASVLKSWNTVFWVLVFFFSPSVISSAALNTNVHVGRGVSKSYTRVEEDPALTVLHRESHDCRPSLTRLLGACVLFSLTYTCLSRIQVFQPAGHLPGVDLSRWTCNKSC